jgi:desulfoferrodoxin (superoxide reductase-like protein)
MDSLLQRRAALKAAFGLAAGLGLARLGVACSEPSGSLRRPTGTTPPNDDDEFVPGEGDPVDVPEVTLPNASWEARAKQLEAEQARLYGPVFSAGAPGIFAGKERSHIPQVLVATQGDKRKLTVTVQHVMGANGLDAGGADAYADAPADVAKDAPQDAAADAAKDAGPDADAGDAGPDAGDAGRDAGVDAAPGDAGADAAAPDANTQVHYVTTIYVRGKLKGVDTVLGLYEFASTDPAPPAATFTVAKDATELVALEWCTLHGLWTTTPITL